MAFKKLVIASGQVSGASHSDFPILIQPSKMTGWEALTLAEAQSIRIYTDEAKTNEVAREVVDGSPDEIWVKVPTLTSSTELYVDYDGVRSDLAVGATYGRNAVWGDYEVVYHMNESSGDAVDSSGNGRDWGDNNSVGSDSGKVGDGRDFDKSLSQYFSRDNSGVQTTGDMTYTLWYKPNVARSVDYLGGVMGGTGNRGWTVYLRGVNPDRMRAISYIGGGITLLDNATLISDNTWYHLAYARSSGNTKFFVNNDDELVGGSTTNTDTGTFDLSTAPFRTSGFTTTSTGDTPNGVLDEVRVRQSALSADWITTEYNNQDDVASFWGTVEDAGGDPPEPVADTGFFAFM